MNIKDDINKNIDKDNNIDTLSRMGWSSHFQTQFDSMSDKLTPARVVGVRKNSFRVSDGKKEWLAEPSGKLRYGADSIYPAAGDWVVVTDTLISKVFERKNFLSRGASGTKERQEAQPKREQVIAANIDTVFIVCGLDRDFNIRRIERYLTLIYNCGLNPVIILTKADLCSDPTDYAGEVESVAFGVPIHPVSASDDTTLDPLEQYLSFGSTCTMVGSSGAGKSTLINRLYGKNIQITGAVSSHVGKGKHTTTSRDLIMMPSGGMIIDNPGIREIAFWEVDTGIESAFPDIEAIGSGCRFADCSHTHEPGCMVLQAVNDGQISCQRLENYRKMKRELEYLSNRQHKSADRVEKEQWKEITMKIRAMKKVK